MDILSHFVEVVTFGEDGLTKSASGVSPFNGVFKKK